MKILVIEDDPSIREGIMSLLRGAGHAVEAAVDGEKGIQAGTQTPFDLVILDLMLPKVHGLNVCKLLRRARPGLPILMLTAMASEDEVVKGLDTGADDYVTKPFSPKELLARVDALGRRMRRLPDEPEILEVDGCRFDLGRCEAKRGEHAISLTPREVGILRWLYQHRNRVVTRADLLENVWSLKSDIETRTVDMTIANLRQKIEIDPTDPHIVGSVKGLGYAWCPQGNK